MMTRWWLLRLSRLCQSADVTFSDVSRPTITTNWTLHFDRHGQITSASRSPVRQPNVIALKP
jgi:hypothetical protein